MSQRIAVYNRAQTPLGFDLAAFAAALQTYVDQHVGPAWNVSASLRVASGPVAGEWGLVFLDDADQPGALAYHDEETGSPLAKVFVRTIQKSGVSLTVSASHELVEMLADPLCVCYAASADQQTLYALEPCLGGETVIPLSDGSRPQIGELAARGLLRARRTARNARTVCVIFSDGTSVRCTPNHRFLLPDGTFREARDLRSGQMLPGPALTDAVDRSEVYAVALGGGASALGRAADRSHIGLGELRASVRFPSAVAIAGEAPLRRGVQRAERRVDGALPCPMEFTHSKSACLARTAWDGALRHSKIVDRVEEDNNSDVFDMTVPARHNFAVAAGVIVHNCDAVEDDSLGFDVGGFLMSDFCYPAWFDATAADRPGTKFDHQGVISRPFELHSGGYAITLKNGQMSQTFGSSAKAQAFAREDRRGHRGDYRASRHVRD